MQKNARKQAIHGAFKLASVFCFWLALMLVLFPVGDAAAQTSGSVALEQAERPASVADEAVVPQSQKLIPLGKTTGIKMFSEGAMVVGFAELEDAGGSSPAQRAGLALGDVITRVNGQPIISNEQLVARLAEAQSGTIKISAKRDQELMDFEVQAVYDNQKGSWKIGCWVRDSIAGIGTITYVDPENGAFGALGHGISDADTGKLMTFEDGSIMGSSVAGVKKGQSGTPGELTGQFDMSQDQGVLYSNTGKGIFGRITNEQLYQDEQAYDVAQKSEIKEGKAYIISNVQGTLSEQYEIEIVRVYPQSDETARDMMIRITDQRLIDITGGIVQGMSGSPIIQNGKLVGAVTHVLINDPLRGYGISIENMMAAAAA